jgi:hypothetical protein
MQTTAKILMSQPQKSWCIKQMGEIEQIVIIIIIINMQMS